MRKSVVLITGAGGEIGHALVAGLAASGASIITLDVSPLEPKLASLVRREFTGSITDVSLLERMLAEFEVDRIYHLAALLSARAEFTPLAAHQVNVEGTLTLLERDGSLVPIPVAPTAAITINGRPAAYSELRRGMVATVIRDGDAPANEVRANRK